MYTALTSVVGDSKGGLYRSESEAQPLRSSRASIASKVQSEIPAIQADLKNTAGLAVFNGEKLALGRFERGWLQCNQVGRVVVSPRVGGKVGISRRSTWISRAQAL